MSKKTILVAVLVLSGCLLAGFAGGRLLRAELDPPLAAGMTAQAAALSLESLTVGPSAIIVGNPKGDVTVIEYFDYQCPVCRRVHPDIQALLAEDHGVRMIHKHWPIFGERSIYASKVALAARRQGRYEAVHDALMRAAGTLDRDRVRAVVADAGLDLGQLDRDLVEHAAEIESIIGETTIQARLIGLRGTPSFLIGRYLVPGGVDLAQLRRIVSDVRAGKDNIEK